jgi:ATP-dependent helicase YprA (DUF1998 family)
LRKAAANRAFPPAPANYAQRSGRAGRAGQPALVITYCAAQSPHDQNFFLDPVRKVHGQVNPPTRDLANRELIQSHLHAVWLSETGVKLDNSIRGLLDMATAEAPIPCNSQLAGGCHGGFCAGSRLMTEPNPTAQQLVFPGNTAGCLVKQ